MFLARRHRGDVSPFVVARRTCYVHLRVTLASAMVLSTWFKRGGNFGDGPLVWRSKRFRYCYAAVVSISVTVSVIETDRAVATSPRRARLADEYPVAS
jgi:hypothetical protein